MKKINLWHILIFILVCEAAGSIGSLFTFPNIASWYNKLIKPPLTPPSWVFGPAWTTLFLLMGVAVYLIWREDMKNKKVKSAVNIFVIQFIFNVLWSFLFFGQRSPLLGLICIIILWFLILLTIIKFMKVNRLAGWLLVPYLLWVGFASYLNWGVYRLNIF